MEYWNNGMMGKKTNAETHYSIIPSFHYFI